MPSSAVSHRQSWTKNLAQLPIFKQVLGCLWVALYLVTLLSLLSFDQYDLGINTSSPNVPPSNWIGVVGANLGGVLYFGFGFGAYIFPFISICCCFACFLGIDIDWRWKPLWLIPFVVSISILLDLQTFGGMEMIKHIANIDSPGGLIGSSINTHAEPYAGRVGTGVIAFTILVISAIYLFSINPISTALKTFSWYREWNERREEERLAQAPPEEQLEIQKQRVKKQIEELEKRAALEPIQEEEGEEEPAPVRRAAIRRPDEEQEEVEPAPVVETPAPKPAKAAPKAAVTPFKPSPSADCPDYILPSLQLLSAAPKSREAGLSDEQLHANLELIVETLARFGVSATPGEITPGATITRYEVYPGKGVRVDKISSLSRDLSRVLRAERINILAPIPGKDTVGIEIPNSNKVAVFLRELFESRDWNNTNAKIPIALGKDVYGKTLVADLAAMPHMLIGGTTGSGKSVCINCILLSFLYRFRPDELRLILIDPKQVEMQVYNAIPHLVVPVVTDPKKVMLALRWVINEMEKRYKILAKVGVRNIAGFNSRVRQEAAPKEESPQMEFLHVNVDDEDEETEDGDEPQSPPIRVPRDEDLIIPDKLPYIVVIIDELADLMQTAPADVESAVARLTAKARAAGIHLIVATQTPRREVVTGVIKTNIPARIAFQVPSGLDSRVILDENGAENLLGRGDLLYRPPGVAGLTRGQGAFVSDEEVVSVVKFSGDQAEAQFAPELDAKLSGKAPVDINISEDDKKLIYECFDVIRQEKKASTSNLQRRLRLGYNRAAYVIDYLERVGVLGPGDGAKPREILVDLESYMLDL